jgi:hypothetical protein
MHIDFTTGLVSAALLASIVLALRPSGGRLIPAIALATAAIAALVDYRVIQLSSTKFRINVILPAVLTLTGAISWSRASEKSAVTAATVVAISGAILLLTALNVLR